MEESTGEGQSAIPDVSSEKVVTVEKTSAESRSRIRDILAFLSTVRGDLSNITSPPYLLAPLSVAEIASSWAEQPSLFVAPALEDDPRKRAFLVLKWFLCCLKRQYYYGGNVKASIKKPLNAFLGELFFGQWTDDMATSKILTEQVSHHPPITACYMWDSEQRITGQGYTRVEMTFNGSITIKQIGHAILHINKYDEDYLIPMPEARIQGFMSGRLYPELVGKYHIVSSTGYISEVSFSGKGIFSGTMNAFTANMYHQDDMKSIYSIKGQWTDSFEIDGPDGVETCECNAKVPPMDIAPIEEQDPWESRRAWNNVIEAIKRKDLQTTIAEKSKVENAQRNMRKIEDAEGRQWTPLFFSRHQDSPTFRKLAAGVEWQLQPEKTKGVWKFEPEALNRPKPYHGSVTPS